jgi:hypothetical protein
MSPYFQLIVFTFFCINNIHAMEWSVLGFSSQQLRNQTGEMLTRLVETSKRGLVKNQGRKDVGQETGTAGLWKKLIIRL